MKPAPSRSWALGLAALVAFVAAGAGGIVRTAPEEGYDGVAHVRYADVLSREGRIPTEAESYEFASPPAYQWLAGRLERITGTWRSGQALSLAATLLLVATAGLLARELWPRQPSLWLAAAALTAAVPVVLRLGVMFHPESLNAALVAAAVWLAARARRRGWPALDGVALGAVLGAAALTRQTAVVAIAVVGAAVLLDGRGRAFPLTAVTAAVVLALAGAWWLRQADRYGNPLESNLDRYRLAGGQPLSFYVSAPLRDLVVHPYRPAFAGELWPQVHADLWSDWFGGQHDYWGEPPSRATRAALTSQSVLGLLATPLALAGLLGAGAPALGRLVRARVRDGREWLAATGLALVLVAWTGFVVQLVRFPQAGGDPIKASYLLFLTPAFALGALAAGREISRRGPGWRTAIAALAGLYTLSYAGFLLTSWS